MTACPFKVGDMVYPAPYAEGNFHNGWIHKYILGGPSRILEVRTAHEVWGCNGKNEWCIRTDRTTYSTCKWAYAWRFKEALPSEEGEL